MPRIAAIGACSMTAPGWLRSAVRTRALALESSAAIGPVELLAEAYGDDRVAPWLVVAARGSVVKERFFLDASDGAETNGSHSKLVTFGFRWAN